MNDREKSHDNSDTREIHRHTQADEAGVTKHARDREDNETDTPEFRKLSFFLQ